MDLTRAVPILTVDDLDAAIASHSQLLGLTVLMNHGWVAFLGSGGAAHFGLMTVDKTAPINPTMSLEVADVDAAYASVTAAGVDVVHPLQNEEWGVRRFFFCDASGNVVNVLSHLV